MGSTVSKRSSLPITVSHPSLHCYPKDVDELSCISTVAMALNDSSSNLQSNLRPKMVVKSSQTSPMNRSNHNLSTTVNGSKHSPPSGIYSVIKQHQSLQVKPRMGRSSLALDDNSNFLSISAINVRKTSLDSESSQNSDDLNNNPRRISPLDKETLSYTPPTNEYIKIDNKLIDEDLEDNDYNDDIDDETSENHANAHKLIKTNKHKSAKDAKKKLKSLKNKDSKVTERKLVKEKKLKEAKTKTIFKKEENNMIKTNSKKRQFKDRQGRSSSCISVVFFFELCSVIGLGLFAALLRFTATFDIVPKMFQCNDEHLKHIHQHSNLLFGNISELWIHGTCLAIPIALVFLLEFFRGIIGFLLERTNHEAKICTLGIAIAPGVRRFFRFIGGYFIGFFVTSILCDALKHQTGILRPTFLHTCPKLEEFCSINKANFSQIFSTNDVKDLCFEMSFRYAQTRFPSSTSAFATFAIGFCVLYLSIALPHRGLRFIKIWAILAFILTYLFLMNVQFQSIQYFPIDIFAGTSLGLIVLLIIFFHLNAFATKISNSNFFSSQTSLNDLENGQNRLYDKNFTETSSEAELEIDDLSNVSSAGLDRDREWFWKSFHIPRVHTLRQSARALWRKTGYRSGDVVDNRPSSSTATRSGAGSPQASTLPARKAAYINPAFSTKDSDYLSAETRFGSTNGNEGLSVSAANIRRC